MCSARKSGLGQDSGVRKHRCGPRRHHGRSHVIVQLPELATLILESRRHSVQVAVARLRLRVIPNSKVPLDYSHFGRLTIYTSTFGTYLVRQLIYALSTPRIDPVSLAF